MQILTDRAADFAPEQIAGLNNIHYIPFIFTLDGKDYSSGVDIQPEGFYELLESTSGMPTTSVPAPGSVAEILRELAKTGEEILYVGVSSGLSGTYNAVRVATEMVPEAKVTLFDTKTLSGAQGWHVIAAARAARAGWSVERILPMLERIRAVNETLYTLPTLKYLIHGGRISHLRGLLATTLNIKPVIAVDKEEGKYAQRARVRTFSKAVEHIPELIAAQHAPGTAMQVQIMHARNIESAEVLHDRMDKKFKCTWLPTSSIAPVLGAHTGAGLVGLAYAPLDQYPEIP